MSDLPVSTWYESDPLEVILRHRSRHDVVAGPSSAGAGAGRCRLQEPRNRCAELAPRRVLRQGRNASRTSSRAWLQPDDAESDAIRRRVFFEEVRASRAPKVTASAGPEPSLGRAPASPWSHAAAMVQKISALQDSPAPRLNLTFPCRDQMDFIRCPRRSVVGNVRLNEGPLRGHGFCDRVQWRVIDVSGVEGTGSLLFRWCEAGFTLPGLPSVREDDQPLSET